MTPLLQKEGKVLIYNNLTFSSSWRRSTHDDSQGGGGVIHMNNLNLESHNCCFSRNILIHLFDQSLQNTSRSHFGK